MRTEYLHDHQENTSLENGYIAPAKALGQRPRTARLPPRRSPAQPTTSQSGQWEGFSRSSGSNKRLDDLMNLAMRPDLAQSDSQEALARQAQLDQEALATADVPTPARIAQVIQELEQHIETSDWEVLREVLYSKLAEPIDERRHAREDGEIPDLIGLGSQLSMSRFIPKVVAVQQRWKELEPMARARALFDAVNGELVAAGVPALDNVRLMEVTARGMFFASIWEIALQKARMEDTELSPEEAAAIADVVLHEAHHAEQYFLAARARAGQGMTAIKIMNTLGIPIRIAEQAVNVPLSAQNGTPRELAYAQRMSESLGSDKQDENQAVAAELVKAIGLMHEQRDIAMSALRNLEANPTEAAYNAAASALETLKERKQKVEDAYQQYRMLAHENSAHEAGVTALFEFLDSRAKERRAGAARPAH